MARAAPDGYTLLVTSNAHTVNPAIFAQLPYDTLKDFTDIVPFAEQPNVIWATGHYRNGILLGPLTGKLVAKGVLSGDWTEVSSDFSPDRFGNDPKIAHADTAALKRTDLEPSVSPTTYGRGHKLTDYRVTN